MKKSLLCLTILLASCSSNSLSSSQEVSSFTSSLSSFNSQVISSSEYHSEVSSSSSQKEISASLSESEISSSEISSSTTNIIKDKTLKELKELIDLDASLNEMGVYESDIEVQVELKLLGVLDHILSKQGAGNRYKLIMCDETSSILVKVPLEVYEAAKNKIGNSYKIKGNLSIYNGNVEITSNDKVLEESSKIINESNLYEEVNLDAVYEKISSFKLNSKGCNGEGLVKLNLKLLGKMDDVVGLFYDGKNIIQVHFVNKELNYLKENSYYLISGFVNVFNYKPSIEFINYEVGEDCNYNIEIETLDIINKDVYNIYYEVDKNKDYPSYTNLFRKLYRYEGYVNYYQKNSSYYTVLEEVLKDDVYSSYTSARSAKSLFLKNENATNLYSDKDFSYNPFDIYYQTSEQIEVIVAPYLWNSNKYWQVYALEDTLRAF